MRLYRPRSASLLQGFLGWLAGMPAEFADTRFPAYGSGREGEGRGRGVPGFDERCQGCVGGGGAGVAVSEGAKKGPLRRDLERLPHHLPPWRRSDASAVERLGQRLVESFDQGERLPVQACACCQERAGCAVGNGQRCSAD